MYKHLAAPQKIVPKKFPKMICALVRSASRTCRHGRTRMAIIASQVLRARPSIAALAGASASHLLWRQVRLGERKAHNVSSSRRTDQ
jgi:hypothetical protein